MEEDQTSEWIYRRKGALLMLFDRLDKISPPTSQLATPLASFIYTFSNFSLLTRLTSIMTWASRMCFSNRHDSVSFPSCWSCLLRESRKLLLSSVRLLHIALCRFCCWISRVQIHCWASGSRMQTALGILSRQVDHVEGEKGITCIRLKPGLEFA